MSTLWVRINILFRMCDLWLNNFLIHHITGRSRAQEGNSTLVRIPALWFFSSPPQSTFPFTWLQHSCAKGIWRLAEQWCWVLGARPVSAPQGPARSEVSHLSCPHCGLRLLWSSPTLRCYLARNRTDVKSILPRCQWGQRQGRKLTAAGFSVLLAEQTLWGKHKFHFMLGPLFSFCQWRCSLIWTEARAKLLRCHSDPVTCPPLHNPQLAASVRGRRCVYGRAQCTSRRQVLRVDGLGLTWEGNAVCSSVHPGRFVGILWQTALHCPWGTSWVSSLPSTLWTGPQPPRLQQESLNTSFSLLLSFFLFSSFPLAFPSFCVSFSLLLLLPLLFFSFSPPFLLSLFLFPQTPYWYLWGSLTGPGVVAVLKMAPWILSSLFGGVGLWGSLVNPVSLRMVLELGQEKSIWCVGFTCAPESSHPREGLFQASLEHL